jgi:hypothetical protein
MERSSLVRHTQAVLLSLCRHYVGQLGLPGKFLQVASYLVIREKVLCRQSQPNGPQVFSRHPAGTSSSWWQTHSLPCICGRFVHAPGQTHTDWSSPRRSMGT